MEKTTGNHSTVFPKKLWQVTAIKEKEAVESPDHFRPEKPWWKKQEEITQMSLPRNHGN